MKIKLTPLQFDALQRLNKPNNYFHFMPYMGRFNPHAYYFEHETMKHIRVSSVEKLYKFGFIKREVDSIGHTTRVRISDKGKAFLNENQS